MGLTINIYIIVRDSVQMIGIKLVIFAQIGTNLISFTYRNQIENLSHV